MVVFLVYFCAVSLPILEVGGYSANLQPDEFCQRAKSQDDARRERLTQARAPGRPVLPFGDVEGSNLRTRDGAV